MEAEAVQNESRGENGRGVSLSLSLYECMIGMGSGGCSSPSAEVDLPQWGRERSGGRGRGGGAAQRLSRLF